MIFSKKKTPYCEEKDDNGEYKNKNADLKPDEKLAYSLLMKGLYNSKYKDEELINSKYKDEELIKKKKKLADEFKQCDSYHSELMKPHIRGIGGKKRKTKKSKKSIKTKKSRKSRKTRKSNH